VIIWSHYVSTIKKLIARYAEFGTVALYGAVDASEQQAIATRFQQDPIGNPAMRAAVERAPFPRRGAGSWWLG
jgi:hypothetical protein